MIDSHIVIPPGSYVIGTVTEVKRPGRVKGRAELYVRFDSLTLPNGVTRDFRSRLGSIDARGDEHLDKKEGMVQGDSNKGGDARTVGEIAASGASIGAIAGAAEGHAGMGAGIGGAAGAAVGLAGVLLTRGPGAVLAKGSTIEMVLDRPLTFGANEVNFASTAGSGHFSDGRRARFRRTRAADCSAKAVAFLIKTYQTLHQESGHCDSYPDQSADDSYDRKQRRTRDEVQRGKHQSDFEQAFPEIEPQSLSFDASRLLVRLPGVRLRECRNRVRSAFSPSHSARTSAPLRACARAKRSEDRLRAPDYET